MKAYRWTDDDGDEYESRPWIARPDDPRLEWHEGPPPSHESTLTFGRLALLAAVGLTAWVILGFTAWAVIWVIWTAWWLWPIIR